MARQNNNPPDETDAWRRLAEHQQQVAQLHLREAFAGDPGRAERFSLGLEQVFVDFSKNLITAETLSLLLDLAEQRRLDKKIDELFSGHEVNTTERCPALHTLLRAPEYKEESVISLDSCLCRNDDEAAGNQPDGDEAAGNQPDGDEAAGNQPDGDKAAGNQPDGDKAAGNQPDGDEAAGNQPDGDEAAGNQPDGDKAAIPAEAEKWHKDVPLTDQRMEIQDGNELSDIARQVWHELDRMFDFVQKLRAGQVKGATGKPINRVVNIGIGGSDLGPRLLVEALSEFQQGRIDIDFVANIDPFDIERALGRADPETTLFIVASKSFTTAETLANAKRAQAWLRENGCRDAGKHFLAISANAAAVERFGVDGDQFFKIEDWTGGRYSIWSCIGMSGAISIGEDNFRQFLAGAHAVDLHFQSSEFGNNIPVILALLSIWYNNFFDVGAHAIIPYDQRLERLPAYLSQLVMESNGKSVSADGNRVETKTSQVIWGGVGSNSQHAVFQFLHQGTRLSSIDFLLPLNSRHAGRQHELLIANCLAQGEALMRGETNSAELHRHFDGNRPSTTILYERLDPHTLGMLLAMYEHKTFVEAAIWGINPFDQWGVELGKNLAGRIAGELAGDETQTSHDPSTQQLINKYRSGSA